MSARCEHDGAAWAAAESDGLDRGCVALPTRVHVAGGESCALRVLYIAQDGRLEAYAPLIQYFIDLGARATLSRQERTTRIVGCLLEYLAAHGGGSVHATPAHLFSNFVTALRCGTQHLDEVERCGLCWAPRSSKYVKNELALLNDFTDWLSNRCGTAPLNPWRTATSTERLIAVRRAEHRSAHALLSHAAYRAAELADAAWARTVQVPGEAESSSILDDVKAFDDRLFPRLLMEGFGLADAEGGREEEARLRNAMIAILMHGGGLRVSEPFHLYVGDVTAEPEAPSVACVRLYHPSEGRAPIEDGQRWRNREHYLADRWGLRPRHQVGSCLHAGWKDLAMSNQREKYARVYWFPTYWGEVFLGLYRRYLALRASDRRTVVKHPYLFVSETKRHRGKPYTRASFQQKHDGVVRDLGLVPEKSRGTTVHGHRHAYGFRLTVAGLRPEMIQRAMRHKSVASQEVYKHVSHAGAFACLGEATERLNALPPLAIRSLLS